ncbi:MAG: potassium channel family protein [Solirubrobacterales bacterium]|nr:potassium channel family protein [Solirubrobacterales bacterium]
MSENPYRAVTQRLALALILLILLATITFLGRDGYSDAAGGDAPLTFVDALYYSTVTITTTGYGDIVPVTQASRLITTLLVTPLRVLFLVLLVGTTLELVADRSRFLYRLRNWKKDLDDHVVVCGFGVKGRSALEYLANHNSKRAAVAIDTSDEALELANAMGISGILGESFETEILRAAEVPKAGMVIVSLSTDELSILTTLRVRELNKKAKIVASCREEQNVELLKRSGATEVIVSASSAGRILGMAAQAPEAAKVVNELLTSGYGLDINERTVISAGEPLNRSEAETTIAVVRDKKVMQPGDSACMPLRPGDQVIYVDEEAPEGAEEGVAV